MNWLREMSLGVRVRGYQLIYQIFDQNIKIMVLIQKAEKKQVYRYLLQEGVIVIHKDFTNTEHKGTQVSNIAVRMLLRSLKDRNFVKLVFSWQYFYYFITVEGKKYLSEFLGLAEEVVPLTWKKDEKRQYEHIVQERRKNTFRTDRPPRADGAPPKGGRGAPRKPREEGAVHTDKPAIETPKA